MSPAIATLMTKCDTLTTEQLIEIARELNLKTSTEEIMVSAAVANVLESRMPTDGFVALMGELEAELMAA